MKSSNTGWPKSLGHWGGSFPGGSVVKNLPANAGARGDAGSAPGWGRSPGRKWQPTPVFLPGKPHGQRSLVSYSPGGCSVLIFVRCYGNLNKLFSQPNICSLSTFHQSLTVKTLSWDFPGGPVIKNPYSQCRGIWVQSLGEELRCLMPRGSPGGTSDKELK